MNSMLLTGVLGLAVLGTAIDARSDTAIDARANCQQLRGTDVETIIPSKDPNGRVLGIVDGVLNGASTAYLITLSDDGLNATSYDVFVTKRGDILIATGVVILTPVPGSASDVTETATLTITPLGSGHYNGASGWIKLQGRGTFDSVGGGTFDVIYHGQVCGPNIERDGR